MRVITQSRDPLARMHTMTKRPVKSGTIDVKALLVRTLPIDIQAIENA
jgi:hypothetical protein